MQNFVHDIDDSDHLTGDNTDEIPIDDLLTNDQPQFPDEANLDDHGRKSTAGRIQGDEEIAEVRRSTLKFQSLTSKKRSLSSSEDEEEMQDEIQIPTLEPPIRKSDIPTPTIVPTKTLAFDSQIDSDHQNEGKKEPLIERKNEIEEPTLPKQVTESQ